MKTTKNRVIYWLYTFIYAQLVVMSMSIPFLAAWGLPFSLMGSLSNLIFAPVLSIFILLSLALLVCELVSVPSGLVVTVITWVSDCWLYVLGLGSQSWLIGLCYHHELVLWLSGMGTVFLLVATMRYSLRRRVLVFGIYVVVLLGYFAYVAPPRCGAMCMTRNDALLTIKKKEGDTHLIDGGTFRQRSNQRSWLAYTLRPTVLKFAGSLNIKTVILNKVDNLSLTTLLLSMEYFCIQKIVLNCDRVPKGKLKLKVEDLRRECRRNKTIIVLNFENAV
jgi:hypothetical protein